jgi:hypothetical protein
MYAPLLTLSLSFSLPAPSRGPSSPSSSSSSSRARALSARHCARTHSKAEAAASSRLIGSDRKSHAHLRLVVEILADSVFRPLPWIASDTCPGHTISHSPSFPVTLSLSYNDVLDAPPPPILPIALSPPRDHLRATHANTHTEPGLEWPSSAIGARTSRSRV